MRTNRIGRLIGVTVGVLACVFIANTGSARLIQGFESGDPSLTGSAGDAAIRGALEGEAAPQGTQQYLITSLIGTADQDGATDLSGTPAVSASALQTFFNGLSVAGTGFRGSGVLIPFTVVAGDTTLSFQYDFLTNQDLNPKNDFAFEAIFNSSNGVVQGGTKFAQVTGTSFSLFGTGSPFIFHTGYQTFSIDISGLAPGTYNLGIGLEALAGGTNQHDSGLLIDNVTAVPEPTTVAFSIAGASLLVALRKRIKKTA